MKLSRPVPTVPLPLPRHLPPVNTSAPETSGTTDTHTKLSAVPSTEPWQQPGNLQPVATTTLQDTVNPSTDNDFPERVSNDPSEQPICAFAAAGSCPLGNSCRNIHGDLCPTCGKHCLHPHRPQEREEHKLHCERNQKNLKALLKSQDIECSVCLERVLSKPTVAERKFGLMSGCDHPFCIGCIRGWRSGSHAPGMDMDTVVRACPVCRIPTHYVVPSLVWYSTADEKEEIIVGYKNKLRSVSLFLMQRSSGCDDGSIFSSRCF